MTRKLTKERSRAYHLKRTYGITLEQYAELLASQNGNCFICERPQTDFKQNFHIDHDHVTLEIRGILCNFCNSRLVGRHRNPDLFRRAAMHLERKTGLFVPPPIKRRRRKMNTGG